MSPELEQKLLDAYPLLYGRLEWGFECGDGWFGALESLGRNAEAILAAWDGGEDERPYASQVKEKFGGLRVYTYCPSLAIDRLIDVACDRAASTCEQCGRPGELHEHNHWYVTRCDGCFVAWRDRT